MRVCETCRHRVPPPPELAPLCEEVGRYFPKVFYCNLLQVVRVYDPSSPAKLFDCMLHESGEK
jgi:hypothetical protein